MEYLIGVLMSASPWILVAVLAAVAMYYFQRKLNKSVKAFALFAVVGLAIAAVSPTNTYKVKAERLPNPVVQQYGSEIPRIVPDIVSKKDERQKRFDGLVDWKTRYDN